VAATCVAPILDLEKLKTGIRAGGDFLQGIGIQFGPDGPSSPEFEAFAQGFLGSSNTGFDLIIEFVTAVGPDLIVNIVEPDGLGVQLFTITTPTLGFTIDPTSGIRGSTVNGQVNPADIAAHCVTDLAAFQAQFQALIEGPYEAVARPESSSTGSSRLPNSSSRPPIRRPTASRASSRSESGRTSAVPPTPRFPRRS
jgi:hypothetical protein